MPYKTDIGSIDEVNFTNYAHSKEKAIYDQLASHGTKCANLQDKLDKTRFNKINDSWQNVRKKPLEAYVYSAFTDPRYMHFTMVRVIGITHISLEYDQLECQVFLPGSPDAFTFPTELEVFHVMPHK